MESICTGVLGRLYEISEKIMEEVDEVKYSFRFKYCDNEKVKTLKHIFKRFDFDIGPQFDNSERFCFSIKLTDEKIETFIDKINEIDIKMDCDDIFISFISDYDNGGFRIDKRIIKIICLTKVETEFSYYINIDI